MFAPLLCQHSGLIAMHEEVVFCNVVVMSV